MSKAASAASIHSSSGSSLPADEAEPEGRDESSTRALLERLDLVTQTVPRLLDNLARALGTLVVKPPGEKDEKWRQNLETYTAYYYGLLDQVQSDLRHVIRQIRLTSRSPSTLRPPPLSHSAPLPPAFAPSAPVALSDESGIPLSAGTEGSGFTVSAFGSGERVGTGERDGTGKGDREGDNVLGLYARRLELKALKDLAKALNAVKEERRGQGGVGSSVI